MILYILIFTFLDSKFRNATDIYSL
jgi:hypothetical protein